MTANPVLPEGTLAMGTGSKVRLVEAPGDAAHRRGIDVYVDCTGLTELEQ